MTTIALFPPSDKLTPMRGSNEIKALPGHRNTAMVSSRAGSYFPLYLGVIYE